MDTGIILRLVVFITALKSAPCEEPYYGKKIGPLSTLFHKVSGDVYAVDMKRVHIRNFLYDGAGPDAFFWAGATAKPSSNAFIIPDERGTKEVLQPYNKKSITMTLPGKKTIKDIKWISVWCRAFSANFGDVFVPEGFEPPQNKTLEPLVGVTHDVSADAIVVLDAKTFLIPNLTYDGQGPDAHFWVGTGDKVTKDGTPIPDENGSDDPLGPYDGKTVKIKLPGNLTVFNIDYLALWCGVAAVEFGHIRIPRDLNVPPANSMLK